MGDREDILRNLKQNKPGPVVLPEIDLEAGDAGLLKEKFTAVCEEVGGQVVALQDSTVSEVLAGIFEEVNPVFSKDIIGEEDLSGLVLFVCEGVFGVAENGAIWVAEAAMGQRIAPFITQHLAIVLDPDQIVATMHDAYDRIAIAEEGFGVFIAGPSKTADIEQSLVLGAHGPRSLTVLLTDRLVDDPST